MKYVVLTACSLLLACHSSQKIYQAPAMGAEAEFDRGLRPEKHPKYLFDKKTMKDMERNGNVSTYTPKRHNTARTIPLPQKAGDSTATRKDSIHVIVDSAKATVLPPDSTHIPQ